jgi:hypothetical protein
LIAKRASVWILAISSFIRINKGKGFFLFGDHRFLLAGPLLDEKDMALIIGDNRIFY